MVGSRRRSSRASSLTPRKEPTRLTKIQENEEEMIANKQDAKDRIMTELLQTLLEQIAIKYEAHKLFLKLDFPNGNSYSGWIGPHGFQGFGTYCFADGSSFRGTFDRSFTKGLGRHRYHDGSEYEGEFLAGRRNGYGKYVAQDFRYEGNFTNGVFNGQGTLKAGNREVNGLFQQGLLIQGDVTDVSGTYKGTFTENANRLYGKFTFKNGHTYTGGWLNDQFHGYGVYNWSPEVRAATTAETKYSGYWHQGARHYIGMLAVRKRYVICQWHLDKRSGAGIIVAINGNCFASPTMFENDTYTSSACVRIDKNSCDIFSRIVRQTISSSTPGTPTEKSHSFKVLVDELVKKYAKWNCELNPLRIPEHEVGQVTPERCCTPHEMRCLQQVLTENYIEFDKLYHGYMHPHDDYMNNMGLNLFYMDVFHSVKDVNIAEVMQAAQFTVANQCVITNEKVRFCPLAPVPFHSFFQHLLYTTSVLIENDDLRAAVDKYRPTYFGRIAMQVLFVLRMLKENEHPELLVREAILINRPGVLRLLHEMQDIALGDKTIRAAYRYLRRLGTVGGQSLHFIEAVKMYFHNIFEDTSLNNIEFDISPLQLLEVVMRTIKLKLTSAELWRESRLNKLMKQCPEEH